MATKIKPGYIDDNAVGTAQIADNSITAAKIAAGVLTDQIAGISSSADATAITIDSSERVGIGTTSPSEKLEVAGNIFINTSGNPNLTVKTSGAGNNPVLKLQADSNAWNLQGTFSNTNDELFFMYNSSTKMAIDKNGNVGIGTTSPSYSLDVDGDIFARNRLFVGDGTAASASIRFNNASTGLYHPGSDALGFTASGVERMRLQSDGKLLVTEIAHISAGNLEIGNGDEKQIFDASGATIQFQTADAERMRITSAGNVGIGTTSPGDRLQVLNNLANHAAVNITSTSAAATEYGISVSLTNSPNDGTRYFLACSDSSTTRAIIRSNGNLQNANNSYGQISDSKLKENIVDATDKLSDIKKVKVRNFNFIGSDLKQIGVVAQELETIFPSMVEETIDIDSDNNELETTTKSVKYSIFVPILVKAIQELTTKLEAAEARITTLEG